MKAIQADEVLVPIVSWDCKTGEPITDFFTQDPSNFDKAEYEENLKVIQSLWKFTLKHILDYSPFHTLEEINKQFEYIKSTGTRIIISKLKKISLLSVSSDKEDTADEEEIDEAEQNGGPPEEHKNLELDFYTDSYDALLKTHTNEGTM